MSDRQPSLFEGQTGAGYRRALEASLEDHLAIVRRHAAGVDLSTPWEYEAALVAVRWIADELRAVSLSDSDVPF